MSGILWASLGATIGILVPFIYRVWQRGGAQPRDTLPTATARQPARKPVATPVSAARAAAPRTPAGLNRKLTRKFHGISIKPSLHACKAAQDLVGQRFLPEEAPAMPLAACDRDKCQCAYSHHGDRRDRDDRRSGWGTFGGFTPSIPGGNRRSRRPDRRGGHG